MKLHQCLLPSSTPSTALPQLAEPSGYLIVNLGQQRANLCPGVAGFACSTPHSHPANSTAHCSAHCLCTQRHITGLRGLTRFPTAGARLMPHVQVLLYLNGAGSAGLVGTNASERLYRPPSSSAPAAA